MRTPREILEEVFRGYYVPLYPKDKPLSEMTSAERGMYKNTLAIGSIIISEIEAYYKARVPKKKEHQKWCRSFNGKNFQCNCMNPDYNQAIDDFYKE